MNVINIPTAEQFDVQNSILAGIASQLGGIEVKSWEDVQRLVRMGIASKVFTAGDQLVANYNGVAKVFDVIGIDHETPTDTRYVHSLTVQARELLGTGQFSAPQAFYKAATELAPGEHVFTLNSVQYKFTTNITVPENGVIFVATWGEGDYVPTKVTTYGADRVTPIESNLSISAGSGSDTLSPINHHQRARYGSANWKESGLRQWLNSDAATFVWAAKTDYDRPSSYSTAGFLNLLDPELTSVIGAVDKQASRNNVNEGGGQDTFSDKVFLLSQKEVGLGEEGTVTNEKVYDFWDGVANAARIKGSPSYWWLRSPYVSVASFARIVYYSGALSYYNASGAYGLAPACAII